MVGLFLRFWSPPPDLAPARVWEELRANESSSGAEPCQPYRCRIDDFLIRRAASDSFNNLGIAASRLRQTRDNEYPQPAEAHYLIMLDKYLTPLRNQRHPGLWARVNRAIRLRRLAERTALGIADADSGYPRSEEVYPWIKPLVEGADERCGLVAGRQEPRQRGSTLSGSLEPCVPGPFRPDHPRSCPGQPARLFPLAGPSPP